MYKRRSNDNRSFNVILTSTICPGEYKIDVERNDPKTRLEDYKRSLLFWGQLEDPRIRGIVFCENSGANLDSLFTLAKRSQRPIEFLGFKGNHKPYNVHYGYSELGIIDYAFEKSELMREAPNLIKATGRLIFPKISKLLNTLTDFDAVIDHRRAYKNENGYPLIARTQLMFFSNKFYSSWLLDCRDEMIGRFSHIEEFIAWKLSTIPENTIIIKRFKIECPPTGFSAFDDKNYQSLSVKYKNTVRAAARRLFPILWI